MTINHQEKTLKTGTKAHLYPNEEVERGLVIIPDVMGLRPLFLDMAQDLAEKWGAATCTLEIFPEHKFPEVEYSEDLKNHVSAVSELKDSRVYEDTAEAATLLKDAGGNSDLKVGLIGFCMGGMFTLKTMSTGAFSKGVAFYPQIKLPEPWKGPGLQEPLDVITPESAPNTMAILGTIDDYTPPEDIQLLEETGAKTSIFEGCDHKFVHDPAAATYNAEAAAKAWEQTETFLFEAS